MISLSQLAKRLGARIDAEAVRPPLHQHMRDFFDAALHGDRESAQRLLQLTELLRRLGVHLDLWALQNQLWGAVRSGALPLEAETLAQLGRALWFDEATLLTRLAAQQQQRATG